MPSMWGPRSTPPSNIFITACKYGTLPITKSASLLLWLNQPRTAIIIRLISQSYRLIIQYPPAPPSMWRGLLITDYIPPSLLLSPASLTGFQTPHILLHHLRLRSPSLCGTPRALSGLKYDMIPASATITQQCGRIVAASGATTPSARATLPTVGVLLSPVPPPRSVPSPGSRCLCLPPSAFLPIIKSVSSPSLLCSPPSSFSSTSSPLL